MRITYVHHSSFLVELNQIDLLFDYTEGVLPPRKNRWQCLSAIFMGIIFRRVYLI